MPSRFIICTDGGSATSASRNMITNFLRAKGWGFWHHFSDLWLVSGAPDGLTARQLRQEISDQLPMGSKRIIVFSAEDTFDRSAWVPKKGWAWLARNWPQK